MSILSYMVEQDSITKYETRRSFHIIHTHIHTYFHIVTTMVAHNRYSLSLSLIHVYKNDNDRIFLGKKTWHHQQYGKNGSFKEWIIQRIIGHLLVHSIQMYKNKQPTITHTSGH